MPKIIFIFTIFSFNKINYLIRKSSFIILKIYFACHFDFSFYFDKFYRYFISIIVYHLFILINLVTTIVV